MARDGPPQPVVVVPLQVAPLSTETVPGESPSALLRFIDLEDTTSAASPFPNMDGYVANVAVNEGS